VRAVPGTALGIWRLTPESPSFGPLLVLRMRNSTSLEYYSFHSHTEIQTARLQGRSWFIYLFATYKHIFSSTPPTSGPNWISKWLYNSQHFIKSGFGSFPLPIHVMCLHTPFKFWIEWWVGSQGRASPDVEWYVLCKIAIASNAPRFIIPPVGGVVVWCGVVWGEYENKIYVGRNQSLLSRSLYNNVCLFESSHRICPTLWTMWMSATTEKYQTYM